MDTLCDGLFDRMYHSVGFSYYNGQCIRYECRAHTHRIRPVSWVVYGPMSSPETGGDASWSIANAWLEQNRRTIDVVEGTAMTCGSKTLLNISFFEYTSSVFFLRFIFWAMDSVHLHDYMRILFPRINVVVYAPLERRVQFPQVDPSRVVSASQSVAWRSRRVLKTLSTDIGLFVALRKSLVPRTVGHERRSKR